MAKEIYTLISKKKLSRGNIKNGLLISCILFACNHSDIPRNVNEVASKCNVSVKCIHKTNKIMTKLLWEVPQYKEIFYKYKHPSQFSMRFGSNLGIDSRITMKVTNLCDYMTSEFKEFSESKEASYIAAGILWNVIQFYNVKIHKTVLCYKCNLSIVTLNKISQDISDVIDYMKYQNDMLQT